MTDVCGVTRGSGECWRPGEGAPWGSRASDLCYNEMSVTVQSEITRHYVSICGVTSAMMSGLTGPSIEHLQCRGLGVESDARLGRDRGLRGADGEHWTRILTLGERDICVMEGRGTRGGADIWPIIERRVEWKMGK